jgi:putative ABC transport system permease protein
MIREAFFFMRYDISKMLGILSGIVISVFLIGNQLGMFNTMLNSMRGMAKDNTEYIWVVSDKTQASTQLQSLDVRIGRELRSVAGVQAAFPLIIGGGTAKFADGEKLGAQIVGLAAPEFVGGPKNYKSGSNPQEMVTENAVMLDASARSMIGKTDIGSIFLVNDHQARLVGFTQGASAFGQAYIFTTIERARKLCNMSPTMTHAYLVRWDTTKASKQAVIDGINASVPHVRAWDAVEFGAASLGYMMRTSNIAVSFGLMVAFAIVAGVAIVGLTMYSSVNDRIRDYGTVKAIGGNNSLIRSIILMQAFLYSILGFCISFAMLWGFKMMMEGGILEISYPLWLITFLVVMTFCISFIGCLFALRKISKLEPVQIFRM